MATFKVFLHPHRNQDKTHTIYIRVIQGRKKKEVSTGIKIEKKYFSAAPKEVGGQKKYISAKHFLSDEYNSQIMYKIKLGEQAVAEAARKNRKPSLAELAYVIREGIYVQDDFDFLAWAADQIDTEIPASQNFDLHNKYKGSLDHLKNFHLSQPLHPWQLNLQFVKQYQRYLLELPLAPGTVAKHLQRFRKMITWAIQHGKLQAEQDPFQYYESQPAKKQKQRRFLASEDLAAYESLQLSNEREQLARDINLFQLYASGARIGDVLMCRVEDIKQTVDSAGHVQYYWQYSTRKSRGQKQLVVLLPAKAIHIYIRYSESRSSGRLFPLVPDNIQNDHSNRTRKLVNSKTNVINKALHRIGERLGLSYKLTTHVARYSFAELGRAYGDITALQDSLGHSSVKTTEIYAKNQNQDRKDKLVRRVFEDQ